MLCQLVCIDRRYQRMNCFNIRELQGILKRRFFTDLVNTSDFRALLDESMVGLRFKTGNEHQIIPNSVLFYNYGLTTNQQHKNTIFTYNSSITNTRSEITNNSVFYNAVLFFQNSTNISSLFNSNLVASNVGILLKESLTVLFFNLYTAAFYSLKNIISYTLTTFHINVTSNLSNATLVLTNPTYSGYFNKNLNENFSSGTLTDNLQTDNSASYAESSDFRFTRFSNALIQYDYKCGNYIGTWDKLYPSLINSYIEVARGVRKPT